MAIITKVLTKAQFVAKVRTKFPTWEVRLLSDGELLALAPVNVVPTSEQASEAARCMQELSSVVTVTSQRRQGRLVVTVDLCSFPD